ncbi:MAG: 2-C-methyl-D-erythritol 4-phosphate cytidylyltransferase, partial [Candidatus Dormibacteraeota bacterium]|nr:2-C-methyl-D-erythritol 4-phosphate cytidylyltransferase [Candidatus Dormibacteraeota bacterium]
FGDGPEPPAGGSPRTLRRQPDRTTALRAALAAVAPVDRVVVHDADRALYPAAEIAAAVRAADGLPAAVAAVPARNTLKQVQAGVVRATVPRSSVQTLLTPIICDRALLARVLQDAGREGRGGDEVALLVAAGVPVRAVLGSSRGQALTTLASARHAELLLRVGQGTS